RRLRRSRRAVTRTARGLAGALRLRRLPTLSALECALELLDPPLRGLELLLDRAQPIVVAPPSRARGHSDDRHDGDDDRSPPHPTRAPPHPVGMLPDGRPDAKKNASQPSADAGSCPSSPRWSRVYSPGGPRRPICPLAARPPPPPTKRSVRS